MMQSQEDMVLLSNVTRILELAVPLMEHPSEMFLAQLEEDMMKLILKHGMMVIVCIVLLIGMIANLCYYLLNDMYIMCR